MVVTVVVVIAVVVVVSAVGELPPLMPAQLPLSSPISLMALRRSMRADWTSFKLSPVGTPLKVRVLLE